MSHAAKRRKAITKRVERKHACPNCDARFPFPNKLRLHINSNHSLANICELCPERFNRFNELRTHMRYAHQIIHQCHLCAYSSSVKAELKKHVVKCHDNGVRCTVDGCAATVAYNRLRRHIKETHCNKPESNLIADGQILEDSLELKNNLIEDSSTGTKFFSPAERSIATNAFSGVEFVSIHDNLLSMDKMQEPISNCISSKTSSQNAETFSHLSATVQHDEATAENCTDRCDRIESGKAFKMERDNSENISREQSLETPTQPDGLEIKDQTISEEISFDCIETGGYKCQECGKIFYDVCKSRRHWNRVHFKRYKERVRLKKYACKISGCTQCFSCPSKLQDHISTAHNEEARFDCETCSRKFRSRSSFAVHLRRYHLVSIRDVPYGFTKGTGISSNNISDETCVIAQNIVGKTEFVTTENIFAKE
uniref:C2H2-type domain-containing protein n=1 Tax=Onchocerca volvulus TaxID=6282 RepID=A0A8R1XRD3_ONCVO